MEISELIQKQRTYFLSGYTKDVNFRKAALIRFRESIKRNEQEIINVLAADFKKPPFESVATEISIVLKELNLAIKNLYKWNKPKRVKPSLLNFPSSDAIMYEPYGSTLIIAPWNYPFQLAVGPMIGAIAAGNTVVLKPSELTPKTSGLLAKIISDVFDENHVTTVLGGKETSTRLLAERWDYIFFTGSVPVGKIVYKAAAKNLTPITLELGGKSPCVIDETAKIQLTAKRIVWGKFVNAGQTCIAPDYILVHSSIKDAFLTALDIEITKALGADPKVSPDFARIINEKNFERLNNMLSDSVIFKGGQTDKNDLYIAPTVLTDVSLSDTVMQEEIFGPVLPVLTYDTKEEIKKIIVSYEKPLSAYVFSQKRSFKNWFNETFSYGGGVINDTLVHFLNDRLPFGGVGHSGIGSYHGKKSFFTFSHEKSVAKRGTWLDIPIRYAPYKGKIGLLKNFMKWL
ncbi:aldehyde dehydrogenase [Dokdonia sp. Hel_I_53]|uniref:aldehyde dehydrogenase n=1 Tax=Dokdonia sp. Hel_I_53 TaxID=1566287 RepID=UPI00119A5CEA|nr:aldehyde dehydrogenase [Dokdonia sp. Hel_I_53]TVZ53420.1 aldehyde dehydrogenase (NAD+) [Dokdonia sp. Hel_I_53]